MTLNNDYLREPTATTLPNLLTQVHHRAAETAEHDTPTQASCG